MADDWQPITTAPQTTVDVRVKNANGEFVAFYACDLSGEEQPPFKGWFIENRDGNGKMLGYTEVHPRPTHWKPV